MEWERNTSLSPERLRFFADLGLDVNDPMFLHGPSWDDPDDPPAVRFARFEEGLRGHPADFRNLLLVPLAEELGVPYTPEPEVPAPPSPASPAEPPGHP